MLTRKFGFVRHVAALAVVLATAAAYAPAADAQYFGRNKVQYRTFDFRIMQSEHFDVYYYPEEEVAARDITRMAERWYARLSRILDHQFTERQPLILYATHPDFQQTNVTGAILPEGTQAFAEPFKQRIVMPILGSYAETDHVLGHELVHAFQYDISGVGRARAGLQAAAQRLAVPLWFMEGMAEYLSVGPIDAHTAMWVRDAALVGELPSIDRLTHDPRVFPYRWGHALWAYIGGRWGDATVGQILKQVGQGVPYPEAFQRILNASLDEISDDWHTSIRRAYLPLVPEWQEPREVGRVLISPRREGGRLNVGPVVSPDGQWVAFLSEMQFLDVELHLANAETGEVVRRLVKGAALDPHFGSLRFIRSAGTWAPDSRRFAFAALRAGTDVVAILDIERGRVLRELRIPGVHELSNPTWSPDGRTIVVSGIEGGLTNLYALDVETGQSRQLTDDRYAYFHPTFSPDGRTLAVVTDRVPGTDLDLLQYGGFQIGLFDMETRELRILPGMAGEHNINPAWTRDGTGLYFVSDRAGIANVYRLEIATGAVAQITRIFTGVSGITALSPAISAARDIDRLLFTSFERNGYNIYAVEEAAALAGTPLTTPDVAMADTVAPLPALLPPHPRPAEPAFNRVALALADPQTGLPSPQAAQEFALVPYRPRLSLDYLGQPTVGATIGGFGGGGIYGGVFGVFSDVLGRHTLFGAVQAQGQIEEIGFSAIYLYSRQRWNYGAAAQRIPLVYPAYQRPRMVDQNLAQEQFIRYRLFDTRLQGLAQYPISHVQRVEFSGGLRRLAQDRHIFERTWFVQNGAIVGLQDQREFTESGVSFNMAEASAALVYDNALFGFTSPFAGQRYRFEINPVFGQLQMLQGLADYRRYFFMRPFTLAVRGLHFGRYGRDSEIFQDIYVGYPWLIRGYGGGDVESGCRAGAGTECRVLEQLFGSRVAVGNAEIRFPLIRQLVLGVAPIGFPPIEGVLFADAGVAWGSGLDVIRARGPILDPVRADLERPFFTSYGVGARVNIFGYFVLEVDYVNPMDRPDRGWHWQFGFQPGF